MNFAIVRQAEASDIPSILEIYNEEVLNSTFLYVITPQTIEEKMRWFEERKNAGFPVHVVLINDVVAGFGSYGTFRASPGYRYTVEHSVYVKKNYRGQGLSKILMEKLISSAKEQNLHVMIAGIDSQNEVSIRLHKSFGFEEVALIKQVGNKFGEWLDLKLLQLILPTTIEA